MRYQNAQIAMHYNWKIYLDNIRGVIDMFAELSSQKFISLSNHLKIHIHVKQLIFTFIIMFVIRHYIGKKKKWYP